MSKSASFARLFMGFILTATGVHASCPIELSPSSVVVKYGDPVSINCSTTVDLVELMGWETTDNPKTLNHSGHLTWTVESTTNWNIHLSCFLTPLPDATFEQCTVTPKFVLYTFPEKISISSSSGSDGVMNVKEEHNFTCHINHVAPVQNLTVRWYKGDKLMHTDAFSSPNKKPENQTSVYSFTPTRQDNGITFRCEAHMDLGPEGPQLNVSSEEKRVTVHFGPDIKCLYSINILEGETLESHCPVEGNPRPSVRWMKDGHGIDPGSPLYRGDAGMYTVKAGGVSVVKKVLIFYGPNLKCPNSYTAVEYVPHNLTCTVEGYPQPNITWYKDREEVSPPENLTRSDAGQYVITASNSLSSDNCTVEITVLYPPSPIVELEDSEVDVGSDVWLKCSSKGNPQPKYSWNYYQTTNVLEESEDGVSRLYIHNATAYNMGSYTCHALNERGNVSKTVRVTVKGAKQECPIKITPDRMVISFNGTGPTATCKQTSTTTTNVKEIYWDVDGSRRTNNESWNADTREDWNADPVCIATFEGLGTCRKPLNFTLYKTPDSVLLHRVSNLTSVKEGEAFPLQCEIIGVAPARNLVVRWYQGNDTLEPSVQDSVRVTSCFGNCNISATRTPVNVLYTISVNLSREQNGAELRCEAWIDLGPDGPQPSARDMSSPLNITVLYKPIINATKLPKTVPVFRGYPEELVCEADGNPLPKIQWFYSTDKVSIMSVNTLTVYEAGFYNCTATNDLGSISHVVEVILKEDYLPLIAGFVAVTVVAISIIFLFIYSIYYKNTKMRRYSLKNPKLSTHNGNVAHNGWDLQFPMTKLS